MSLPTLFQYAVILDPPEDDDGKTVGQSMLIVEPTTVLCADSDAAHLRAARAIPREYADDLDRVRLVVRPF